jgi:hypothetical protein
MESLVCEITLFFLFSLLLVRVIQWTNERFTACVIKPQSDLVSPLIGIYISILCVLIDVLEISHNKTRFIKFNGLVHYLAVNFIERRENIT